MKDKNIKKFLSQCYIGTDTLRNFHWVESAVEYSDGSIETLYAYDYELPSGRLDTSEWQLERPTGLVILNH